MTSIKSIYLTQPLIKLSFSRIAIFSVVFTALAVATPWVFHQFSLAGPIFLPMHFFVLIAGLLFGWRTGLVVGLATPLVSFFTSGMPPIPVLPQITIETAFYGLAAGLMREKFNLNIWLSLILALVIGRFAMGVAVFALKDINTFVHVWSVTKVGFWGIALQLIFVVPVVNLISSWIKSKN